MDIHLSISGKKTIDSSNWVVFIQLLAPYYDVFATLLLLGEVEINKVGHSKKMTILEKNKHDVTNS